jgi:hypothetical protein
MAYFRGGMAGSVAGTSCNLGAPPHTRESEMATWMQCKTTHDFEIVVNIDLVTTMQKSPDSENTLLRFGHDHTVFVKESPTDIIQGNPLRH